jgi:S1-C subfamily serine protease
MGTVPSFEEHAEPGYFIGDVVPGGPAEEAGLEPGDRIVKILDRRVTSVYDFMFALEDLQPGQAVPVWVIRDGEELEFEVTLAAKGVTE